MYSQSPRQRQQLTTFDSWRHLLVLAALCLPGWAQGQETPRDHIPDPSPITIETEKPKKSAVPPGFESLSEPQTTAVDIYLGDEYLLSQMATFTPDEITFNNPRQISEQIPLLLDPAAVREALSKPQTAHAELVCFYQGQENCGHLQPEVAGVIFNRDRFRVDLFINNELLAARETSRQKYLPASDSGWSLLQSLNAAYAGASNAPEETYSINSGTTLAYRESRFQLNGNLRNDDENNIDTAAFRRDWEGTEYQLGYFRSNSGNFRFMSDSPIRGGRFASSLDTREDLRQSAGNELLVFLTTRSEVSLFKDGRLISTRIYDAGNQILDTSQLPGGAYDVTIQIRDAGGNVSEETRFYAKSNQLPPSDQALYFVEAGELLDTEDNQGLAKGSGLALIRAGYHYRITDQFAAMAGATQVEDLSSLELGFTHLGRYHDISIGGFVASQDRTGGRVDLRTRLGPLFLDINYRKVNNNEFDPLNPDPADLFGESNTQAAVNFTTLLPVGRLDLNGRINRREDDTIETYTARYEFPRLRLGISELFFGLQFSREEGVNTGLFTFEVRGNSNHVTGRIRPEYTTIRPDNGNRAGSWKTDGVLSWHDRELLRDSDLRLDLRAREQENGERENESGYGAEAEFAAHNGRLRVQTERVSRGPVESTRYNGNAFTSFMVNRKNIKLGGREQSQSALLIDVSGEVEDARFDIMVDGNHRGIAYANRITVLNLRPYETYEVQLVQQGSSFVEFEQQARKVTLYPGNVVTLDWTVAELDVVFGRIVDRNGEPVPNALISGVTGLSTTDDFGLFQAEMRRDVKQISVETITSVCTLTLPDYTVNQHIGNLGSLRCNLQPKDLSP